MCVSFADFFPFTFDFWLASYNNHANCSNINSNGNNNNNDDDDDDDDGKIMI